MISYFNVTIEGVSGSFRELQSNRVDDKDVAASDTHRHFNLQSPGKLTLNYLKLTWGEAGSSYGGFIYMSSGFAKIKFSHIVVGNRYPACTIYFKTVHIFKIKKKFNNLMTFPQQDVIFISQFRQPIFPT